MQVKTTARRLLQAGLLNPTAPASRRSEGSASRAASSGCSDRVEISREGRTAALSGAGTPEPPAEKPNQPDGFDFTGVDWETFDWDSWEMPTLDDTPRWRREIDPGEYRKKKMEVMIRNYGEIEDRVKAYYQPEYDKIKGMSKDRAMDYLWDTYKEPFSGRDNHTLYAPNGMTRREADVAYDQLLHLYFYNTTALLADSYALSPSDIRELNTVESRAVQETDQYFKDAWDAAHPGYDPEKAKAERKAAFRKKIELINSTNLKDLPPNACLSQKVLSLPAEAPGEWFQAEA